MCAGRCTTLNVIMVVAFVGYVLMLVYGIIFVQKQVDLTAAYEDCKDVRFRICLNSLYDCAALPCPTAQCTEMILNCDVIYGDRINHGPKYMGGVVMLIVAGFGALYMLRLLYITCCGVTE
jgi:hypothetical protein